MVAYCEYMFSKRKTPRDYVINTITVLVAIVLIYFLTTLILFGITSMVFLIPAIWFGIIWGALKIIQGRNIEYEYLLTGCDLDVDKITNKSRRHRIVSVRRREIEIIAPMDSDKLPSNWKNLKTIDVTSGYNPDAVYVMIANISEKTAVIFEPSEKMKENYSAKLPSNVFCQK